MPNLANVDLRLLRVFVAVVDCGGFSAAQTQLNLSQSTISNHMIALEARLRCKLCQRGRGGFELTDDGTVVHEAALRLFASIDAFQNETEALRDELTGRLRIGVVDNTVTDPLSPIAGALSRFAGRASAVRIELVMDSPPALQRRLVDRRLDMAVFGFAQPLPNLRSQPLYLESSALYCGRGHPLFEVPDPAMTLARIRAHPFSSRSYWAAQDLERLGMETAALTAEHMEAQLMLVLSGAYTAYLPIHYAARWVQERWLRALMINELSYSVRIQLSTRKGAQMTPAMTAFAQELRAVAAKLEQERGEAQLGALHTWRPRSSHRRKNGGDPGQEIDAAE